MTEIIIHSLICVPICLMFCLPICALVCRWLDKRRAKKPEDCEWLECCDCSSPSANKERYCEKCDFYWWVDSGYGYCRALHQFVVVAWCRDICSLFKARRHKNG